MPSLHKVDKTTIFCFQENPRQMEDKTKTIILRNFDRMFVFQETFSRSKHQGNKHQRAFVLFLATFVYLLYVNTC